MDDRTNKTDYIENISLVLFFINIIIGIYFYFTTTGEIPTHFDISGTPDRFGSKISLLWVSGFSTFIYILLAILKRYPEYHNLPVKITSQNKETQFLNSSRLLVKVKFIIMILLFTVLILMANYKAASGFNLQFLPMILIVLMIGIVIYHIRISVLNK